ncbi:FMAR-like protein [Mya arenaria]|uniref:FMAR-like protein n=1 Tax=Mya arenaria TaxID=6604 RepID=A0ABY7DEW7_MYAAR|nr:FMAR-like protein [Mya arenaria]
MNHSDMANGTEVLAFDTGHILSHEVMLTARQMHHITSAYIGPVFLVLGLFGNLLSIVIWRKKLMKSSTGTYLIAQAVNDIGVLIFFFLTDSLIELAPWVKMSNIFGVVYAYIGYPMFYFFVVNSIWTLVGVTIDRYVQVCWIDQAKILYIFPLQTLCNERAAQIGVALISVLSFIINMPHFNTYRAVPNYERDANETAYEYTEFGHGAGSQLYEFWIHCMFLVLAPWVSIMFMNMAIIFRVGQLNKKMLQMRGNKAQKRAQRKENQMTNILLTVTFTFLGLIALQCVTQCFFMMQPENMNFEMVNEAYSVAKLGIVINSSINFILYCVTGKRFRNELRLMLFRLTHIKALVPLPGTNDLYNSQDPDLLSSSPTISKDRKCSMSTVEKDADSHP